MRVGVQLAQAGRLADPATVRAAARSAESLGYRTVWVRDAGPVLDPIATLAFAAACTEIVRVGTNVLVAPRYRPAPLARALTAVDVLSGGRLTVGLDLGTGGDGERGPDEVLDDLDGTWAAAVAGPDVAAAPVQRPRPPVLLAGSTRAVLERTARRADGWTPSDVRPVDLAAMWTTVRDLAAGHGRDPDRLELVVRADVALDRTAASDRRRPFAGSVDQVVDDLAEVAAAGAHEVLLALDGDLDLDATLDGYAALAEGLELRRAA
jgi:alkanesulfonate monooxygenase SsuD/methylene tetrahydromethanopterin reductase-like flavin-dependent oxidoreductase (luciferase family)